MLLQVFWVMRQQNFTHTLIHYRTHTFHMRFVER